MPEKLGGYGRNDWVGFAGISKLLLWEQCAESLLVKLIIHFNALPTFSTYKIDVRIP